MPRTTHRMVEKDGQDSEGDRRAEAEVRMIQYTREEQGGESGQVVLDRWQGGRGDRRTDVMI